MRVWVNDDGEITFGDVFNAICVETPRGTVGIAQRDGGVEIMHEGKLVWSSDALRAAHQDQRSAVRALVARWRAEAVEPVHDGSAALDVCADELEALFEGP